MTETRKNLMEDSNMVKIRNFKHTKKMFAVILSGATLITIGSGLSIIKDATVFNTSIFTFGLVNTTLYSIFIKEFNDDLKNVEGNSLKLKKTRG